MKKIAKRSLALTTAAMMFAQNALAFPVDFAPGTPLVEALRALGFKANKNVIINGDLDGTVSMSLSDTTFDSAVKALALTHNFSFEEIDNTVLIAPQKSMNTVATFKLKHLEPAVAAKQMGLLVDDDNVVVNNDLHSITVSGSSADLNRIERQIDELDRAQQQVNIKATFIELSKGKTRDLGLSYTSDSWSKNTSVSGYNGFVFSVTGAHEETLSKGNVLARPNVTTFDGRQAKIMMGDKVPVFTSSSDSTDSDDKDRPHRILDERILLRPHNRTCKKIPFARLPHKHRGTLMQERRTARPQRRLRQGAAHAARTAPHGD